MGRGVTYIEEPSLIPPGSKPPRPGELDPVRGDDYLPTWEEDFPSPIVTLIKQSKLYRDAHSELSADKRYGIMFLSELEAIPESYTINYNPRNYGGSKFDKQMSDMFRDAMDEIRVLMQRYHNFIATLPVSEVEQLQDAGINASITGEGVTPSSPESVDPVENTSDMEYSRQNIEAISAGISGFLSFVDAFSGVAGTALSGIVDLGGLAVEQGKLGLEEDKVGIAKDQNYREQESHDLGLIKQGVSPTSPSRSGIASSGQSVLKDYSDAAVYRQRLDTVSAQSDFDALSRSYSIPGNPRASGIEVFNEMSRFKLQTMFANLAEQSIKSQINEHYSQIVGTLDREYLISEFSAASRQNEFDFSFTQSRDPELEGSSQSALQSQLVSLRNLEIGLAAHQSYMNDLRELHILAWQDKIEEDPSLLPFYYKAALDFDMTDVFHHQDALHQNVHYGLDVLNSSVGIIESISRSYDNFSSPEEKAKHKADREDKRLTIRQRMAAARAAMLLLK